MINRCVRAGVACAAVFIAAAGSVAGARPPATGSRAAMARLPHAARHPRPRLDTSGRTRVGKASFYSAKFNGRRMADGSRMDPQGDGAASKTLPLGTTARVTNLETGQSAVVTIRDRGPHVAGRIVDLSPATARKVGIDRHEGVSEVAVTPLRLPASAASAMSPGPIEDARPAGSGHRPTSTPG